MKYVSGDASDNENPNWDRDEIFRAIEEMIDLNNSNTNFIKTPKYQEESVAGMFFEAIGSNKITEIKPLTSGYKTNTIYMQNGGIKML